MPDPTKNIAVRALVVEASRRGYTQSQIAERLGVSRQRVHSLLREAKYNPAYLATRKTVKQQVTEFLEERPDGSWSFQELFDHVEVGLSTDPETKKESIKKVLKERGYAHLWVRPLSYGALPEPPAYEPEILPAFTEKPRKKRKPIPLELICTCPPKEETQERAEITALDYVGAAIADGRVPMQKRFDPPELPDLDDAIGF